MTHRSARPPRVARPALIAPELFLVPLALDPGALARCHAVLAPDERARAGRFLRPVDRDRFAASRAGLRLILGRALGVRPVELRFLIGPAGKPHLADGALEFNLSHSGGVALVGLARGAAIGVDVEAIRPLPDALAIARGHFAPDEVAALAALPPRAVAPAFFGLWTRKEAVVKALGTGLSLPLAGFSVSLPPQPPRLLRITGHPGPWTLSAPEAGPGYAAAFAVRAEAAAVAPTRLPPGWTDDLA